MYNVLGNIFGNTLGAISNAVNTKQTNKTNLAIAQMTNANNRQLVEMQNKAAKEESELAYRRSMAGNQVKLMQQAGMSRAGAINALNGGGSYTPAPVNTSQDQGATMQTADLGALANIGQALEGLSQRKHEKEMQAKQLAVQKEMQEQQLASAERIAQLNVDTTNRNADNNINLQERLAQLKHLEYIEDLQYKYNDLQFRKDQYEYGKKLIDAQTELTKQQKDDIKAKLEEWKSEPAKTAREVHYQLETIAAQYHYKVNEADLQKYLHDHFVYDKDSDTYVPRIQPNKFSAGVHAGLSNAEQIINDFWDLFFTLIPIKPLLQSINLFGK